VTPIEPDFSKWEAWRPEAVARLFVDVSLPWYVAAGWALELFREPSDGDTGICRREPAIRMPYARLIDRTGDGIPYGRPEVVLLFKAKHAQEQKNQADFEATLPLLDSSRVAWLRDALERVHPGHRWLEAL
jgi:hypothetical protein